ncbi:hypothetical protein RA280_28230 [Cupriavidus sp. CV2]|uniref:hypothetical protein n=1 Tax=Cupriavidus ulmosensis TaxID=3065913 RepID=UPI00296AC203|nr:hypothetical protein [Cupriavidus sp. CV2]MDW3685553.1 hypothetical protein [Cupriavidus sp. CV2]
MAMDFMGDRRKHRACRIEQVSSHDHLPSDPIRSYPMRIASPEQRQARPGGLVSPRPPQHILRHNHSPPAWPAIPDKEFRSVSKEWKAVPAVEGADAAGCALTPGALFAR